MTRRFRHGLVPVLLLATILAGLLTGCSSDQTEEALKELSDDTTPSDIAALLAEKREAFQSKAPDEARRVLGEALDSLRRSGMLDSALNVGDTIPRFALADAVGDTLDISDLLLQGPVVIVFYRGNW